MAPGVAEFNKVWPHFQKLGVLTFQKRNMCTVRFYLWVSICAQYISLIVFLFGRKDNIDYSWILEIIFKYKRTLKALLLIIVIFSILDLCEIYIYRCGETLRSSLRRS